MAAKQTQSTKRQVPHQGRSVMLTRFKLSQQKRQLREKERKTSETKGSPIQKAEDKKVKSKVTPPKDKRNEDLRPSKLKRKIAAKKIVLKARHELKLIGGSAGCKRKLNLPQKGLKSPPTKRKKTCHSFSPSEPDRSQSPIYSELGFEEVIRMVDENQSLDDDDLLEILTCPSPVWWEDPPDDRYMDGPITANSPISAPSPTFATQYKSKTSRKKTPHKLILEPEISTNNTKPEDTQDTDNKIDETTFKDIKKSDDRFRNKRSKLESLLNVLKNKKEQPKCENNTNKKEEDINENHKETNDIPKLKSTHNKTIPNRSKKESETELDDITFANISQQDKDSLKHLENIEIPMEGESKTFVGKIDPKPPVVFRKKPTNPSDAFKTIKKSKNIPGYLVNKKWKILNIKKMAANSLIQKMQPQGNILSPKSILKVQRHSTENKNGNKEDRVIKSKLKNQNLNASNGMDTNIASKDDSENEDYVTIIKIISNTNESLETQAILQSGASDEVAEENKQENDLTDKESKTLDSYYKKCKGRKRDIKSNKDNAEVRDLQIEKEESINDVEELCDSCDKNTKKSIVVSSANDVKYCLKCSCIFDKEECDYCIRKEREKHKTQEDYEENIPDEIANGFHSLSNKNNSVDA